MWTLSFLIRIETLRLLCWKHGVLNPLDQSLQTISERHECFISDKIRQIQVVWL